MRRHQAFSGSCRYGSLCALAVGRRWDRQAEKAIMNNALVRLVFYKKAPRRWKRNVAMRGWSSQGSRKFIGDRDVMRETLRHTCVVCGSGPDQDIRHLTIDCLYDVSEVSPSFVLQEDKKGASYTMPICKGCRANFLFTHLARFISTRGRLSEPGLDSDGLIALFVAEGDP